MKIDTRSHQIGEMMLAKTVLEEKNEAIESRDRTIRELRSQLQVAQQELSQSVRILSRTQEATCQQGIRKVLQDVLEVVARYQEADDGVVNMLAGRLLQMLKENYGVEVLERAPPKYDPAVHEVVDVEHASGKPSSITVVSKGFVVHGAVLRPMKVRVVRGYGPGPFPRADPPAPVPFTAFVAAEARAGNAPAADAPV